MVRDVWKDRFYFRTYEIASKLQETAGSLEFLGEIADLELIGSFLTAWQEESVVHKVAKMLADRMFYEETGGPYFVWHDASKGFETTRRLSVDVALSRYGYEVKPFKVPPSDGQDVRRGDTNILTWVESNVVADACFDYFNQALRDTQEYEDLLSDMAEEVFHLTFHDRVIMYRLNRLLAFGVQEYCPDDADPNLWTKSGRLRRKAPPKWAKSAVFFREHGRCASCKRDLTGLLSSLPEQHFDHLVPLAEGGLNDVTNLQLLCADCNLAKSSDLATPSNRYRRWY